MPTRPYSDFNLAVCKATKTLRERRNITQMDVANVLQIETEAYKKYENRSPLPHFYIPKLCLLYGISIDEFYSLASSINISKPAARLRRVRKTSLAS